MTPNPSNDNQQDTTPVIIPKESLGAIDLIVGRVISRKFFVFLTATGLLTWSNLDSDTWGMIAMIYIGGQTVIDAAVAWKHGSK
jgi:hypothetical protein|tara:strand:- start:4456 stop:4707 length:252 start_codon:yes stop_codon:yes gene_type:complete